jgi:hypothetical protein
MFAADVPAVIVLQMRSRPGGLDKLATGSHAAKASVPLNSFRRSSLPLLESKVELILAAIATYIQKLRATSSILAREDALPPGVFVRELTRAIISHTQRNDLDLNEREMGTHGCFAFSHKCATQNTDQQAAAPNPLVCF